MNYREDDFVDSGPYDVILDLIGAKYLARNVEALAVGGRLMVIGLQGGAKAELDIGKLLQRARVHATSLRARPLDEKAVIVAGVREHVWPLLASGRSGPSSTGASPWRTRRARTSCSKKAVTSARSC